VIGEVGRKKVENRYRIAGDGRPYHRRFRPQRPEPPSGISYIEYREGECAEVSTKERLATEVVMDETKPG
jgi:hypothetical protein